VRYEQIIGTVLCLIQLHFLPYIALGLGPTSARVLIGTEKRRLAFEVRVVCQRTSFDFVCLFVCLFVEELRLGGVRVK